MRTIIATIALCLPFATAAFAAESEAGTVPYRVLQTVTLGGDGGWDYLTVDEHSRRLYIARANRVMVVDLETNKVIGEIAGNGVHGVAIVPTYKRGFISNGKDDTATIFNSETLEVIGHVPAGKKPDAIIYEPTSDRIYVADNGGTTMTILAAADGAAQKTIELGGAPEFVVSDGKGHVYVNLEDKSQIAVIDVATLTVTAHWDLAGKEPTGLAIDREHRRLFSGCRGSKTMEVLDADSGKTLASLPIGAGVDATAFDPATSMAFSSNGDGTLTIVHEDAPGTFRVVQTLPTKAGARTMVIDAKTQHILLATAEREVDPSADPNTARRAPIKPGTFAILVVGR